jgi:hypothetical protein
MLQNWDEEKGAGKISLDTVCELLNDLGIIVFFSLSSMERVITVSPIALAYISRKAVSLYCGKTTTKRSHI